MARIYKYAILVAIPNERRGERVNIGLAVFRDRTVDVRLMHASQKLSLLTRESWAARLDAAKDRLSTIQAEGGSPADTLERFSMFEPLVSTSGLGSMSVDSADDYERQVEQILSALVSLPPRPLKTDKSTRINTEIARELRQAKVLAAPGQGVDHNKVVRDYAIDTTQGLTADFALRNGVMHIIATLDLRRKDVDLGVPALKSLTLDGSLKKFGKKGVKRFGAYAVEPGMHEHYRQHLEMLGNHATDGLWDWSQGSDRNKFRKNIFDALEHDDPLI